MGLDSCKMSSRRHKISYKLLRKTKQNRNPTDKAAKLALHEIETSNDQNAKVFSLTGQLRNAN